MLLIPLLAFIFYVEILSVVIQVFGRHILGRRIFKMAPIHHHFDFVVDRRKNCDAFLVLICYRLARNLDCTILVCSSEFIVHKIIKTKNYELRTMNYLNCERKNYYDFSDENIK
jgi:hypothetical protein